VTPLALARRVSRRVRLGDIGDIPRIVLCSDVKSHADDLNLDMQKTHTAIESSGVGATDRAWLSQWEAFVSQWTAYYATIGDCSAWLPGSPKPATMQDEVNHYADELVQWQTQAQQKGIVIPGGVRPAPPDTGSLWPIALVAIAVIAAGAVGVGFLGKKGSAAAGGP
jgi:hypothetical protein